MRSISASFLPFLVGHVLAANICGSIGIHNATQLSYYMGNFFYNGPQTFSLCALYCKKDTNRCKSFRYAYYPDAAAQYCEFFASALEGNFTVDPTQPYYYYDIGCAFPAYADMSTATVTAQLTSSTCTQTTTTRAPMPPSTETQIVCGTSTSATTVSVLNTQMPYIVLTTMLTLHCTGNQGAIQSSVTVGTPVRYTVTSTLVRYRTSIRSFRVVSSVIMTTTIRVTSTSRMTMIRTRTRTQTRTQTQTRTAVSTVVRTLVGTVTKGADCVGAKTTGTRG